MILKIIKTILFLFLITFTTHSFAKSNEYYKQTLTHILTQCNSECQKKVFEQEQAVPPGGKTPSLYRKVFAQQPTT